MKNERIIFWQEHPSPHQASWIRALTGILPGSRVIGVFQKELVMKRIALGWQPPDYGMAQILISPRASTVDELLVSNPETTVHIFSGIVHNPTINVAFRKALASGAYVGILSEGRDWRRWKGMLRYTHTLFHERRYRQSIDFVLAIGQVGVRWFMKCGYEPERVFPFCYVVENPENHDLQFLPGTPVQLTAIGQLIPRKRFDLLLESLARIPQSGWTLRIIGAGERLHSLESMAKRLGIDARVAFKGVMDNHQVRYELAQTDLLILPSRWDGWGAVVNEALMSGVPVLCSDYCGAADLIRPGFNGELFGCDSLDSLVQALSKWVSNGPLAPSRRNEIKHWSRCIEGEAVARYFLDVINYSRDRAISRPTAPW